MSGHPLALLGIAGSVQNTPYQLRQLEQANAALEMALQQAQYEARQQVSQAMLNALHADNAARMQRTMDTVRVPDVYVQAPRVRVLSTRLRLARSVMRLWRATMRCYARAKK